MFYTKNDISKNLLTYYNVVKNGFPLLLGKLQDIYEALLCVS